MIEVEISVAHNQRLIGDIIYWVVAGGHLRGRIEYNGTDFRVSRFRFSNIIDAVYFKLALAGIDGARD